LVHRRLSIIDTSAAGRQPMQTADGRFIIVFNGELYNYIELRKELIDAGHTFQTDCDTEVLLKAYVQWGTSALKRFVGMFAFAILDANRRKILLARDFFGIKPLYYARTPLGIAFGSEIKVLLEVPGVAKRVNPAGLYDYLRFGMTDHSGETLLSGVSRVPAAHYIELSLDSPEPSVPVCYWNIDLARKRRLSLGDAADEFRGLFKKSIGLHMRSDVPVGSALSGGLDSTSIVGAMRKLYPAAEIHTFSYVADDASVGEEKWIDLATEFTGSMVHKVRISAQELAKDLDHLIYSQDEPFLSTSIYAQYRVFRSAQEAGIKVLLDGQGADELLGGYNFHFPSRLFSLLKCGNLAEVLRFLGRLGSQGIRGKTVLRMIDKLSPPPLRRFLRGLGGEELVPPWLNAAWLRDQRVEIRPPSQADWNWSLIEDLRQALTTMTVPMLLRYEDRNSMAHSVESRVPFLTPEIAEFALSLPEEYLISSRARTKVVLRHALRGMAPDAILDRSDKIGFETPQGRWLLELKPWVDKVLDGGEGGPLSRVLNFGELKRFWRGVTSNRFQNGPILWRALNAVRWVEIFGVSI
jgi:asparagine synthase (glutamine-hydrolysing)